MRWLPQVVLATFVVAVLPVVLAWWLRADAVISSPWLCVAVAIFLSIALSVAGSAYWKRRRSSADVLFSELLIWGWLRRYRIERQLASAAQLLTALPGLGHPGREAAAVEHAEQRLRQLGTALEAQDPYLEGHSRRVARHSAGVARKLGLPQSEVARVRSAAAVHDVGKLRIHAELLRKPGALTDAEFEAVMRHAEEGAAMVACLGDPELTAIVRHHHERFDGMGYPAGLLGEEIPLGARIVAVADTFDAITSVRPYRAAARHKQALDVLVAQSGTQLDPAVVRAFLRYYSGRRASLLWIILAASPQRALAAVRGRTGGPIPVPVGDLAVSAVGRMAICAAAVGSTVGLGVTRYDGPLVQPSGSLQIASAAPFSLHLSAQRSPAKSRSSAHSGGVLGPVAQLGADVLLAGSRGAGGGAGGAKSAGGQPHRGPGGPSPSSSSGGWVLTSTGSNGSSSGGGRGGAGGGSGMRTGVTPTGTPRRPSVGGTRPGGPTTAPTAPVAGASPAGGGAPGGGTPTIVNGTSAPSTTPGAPSSSPSTAPAGGGTPGGGGAPGGGPPAGGGGPVGGGTTGAGGSTGGGTTGGGTTGGGTTGGGTTGAGGNSGGGDSGHGQGHGYGDGHGYGYNGHAYGDPGHDYSDPGRGHGAAARASSAPASDQASQGE